SSYNYQLTAGYEVDLWGRIETSSEAALYEYRASREELKTAAITLSARVAASWSRLINQKKIIDLEEKILATQENRLELLQKRFRNGQVNLSEINRAKKELKSARNSIYTARTKYEALKNELAVLTGQDPRESIKTGGEELPRPDQLPEAGLSADLVRRRPDVRKTFYNIQARDRQLAASISKQYPRLNLKFTGSGSSVDAADLFEQWAGAFSVKLVASLLDGGEDRAEVRRSEAQRDETVHKYGQTVLEAFREVEDAVNQEKSTRRQLENIEDNLELVRGNYQQASLRYQNGSARYSMVLAEQLNHYRAKRDYLTKRRELFEDRVELYRVLSGGWEM
ncbi:MAG: TolC family protein, partial [bacterium]